MQAKLFHRYRPLWRGYTFIRYRLWREPSYYELYQGGEA